MGRASLAMEKASAFRLLGAPWKFEVRAGSVINITIKKNKRYSMDMQRDKNKNTFRIRKVLFI